MSQWTHVSGCLRLDGIPAFGAVPSIPALLGVPSSRDYDAQPYESGRNIPGGSEGTIQYEATVAGDGLVWMTVAIWGDLRDFGSDDCPKIDDWFTRVAQGWKMVRAAHLMVEVEGGERYMLVFDADSLAVNRLSLAVSDTPPAGAET